LQKPYFLIGGQPTLWAAFEAPRLKILAQFSNAGGVISRLKLRVAA
jgi:hypothetical protein